MNYYYVFIIGWVVRTEQRSPKGTVGFLIPFSGARTRKMLLNQLETYLKTLCGLDDKFQPLN